MRSDPMDIKAEHIGNWRQRFDQLGSSASRRGHRKTFDLNPAGSFIVREWRPDDVQTLYRGEDATEAMRVYNEA